MLGPTPLYVYTPDRRTALFSTGAGSKGKSTEKEIASRFAKLIHESPKSRQRDWGRGLAQVQLAPFAFVLDNTDLHYVRVFSQDLEQKDISVLEALRFLALGIELGDGRPVRVVVDAQSEAAVALVEKAFDSYARQVVEAAREPGDPAEESIDKVMLKLATELLQSRRLERHGASLEWQAHSSVRVKDFIEAKEEDEKRTVKNKPGK